MGFLHPLRNSQFHPHHHYPPSFLHLNPTTNLNHLQNVMMKLLLLLLRRIALAQRGHCPRERCTICLHFQESDKILDESRMQIYVHVNYIISVLIQARIMKVKAVVLSASCVYLQLLACCCEKVTKTQVAREDQRNEVLYMLIIGLLLL
ncbi:uncharacterized protein LOC108986681 isoform X2 [Juglans regia]|uniref:Uncharacterized protein LOC108986681 isoform X2 n=1 Tax=Juglans regia TaxID=51240 RepID=A0A2I4E690_JUGRE|nr:uncharacterized protein LOC108986681 isoform X2 [Juglans regia]